MDIFDIAGEKILLGESRRLNLPVGKLYTNTSLSIPVSIIRGNEHGPVLFISAAIHGDEINGIEIIHRLIKKHVKSLLRGTVIFVPMVNVYGVLDQSRYLPDRRDLNRTFPGSQKGSLTARMAYLFMSEIVSKCDYGIDIHTGTMHRTNLPQIRADLDDPKTLQLAESFDVPVLINADMRPGSLRQAASEIGVKVLLYEAGEALRFNEFAISTGVKGVLNVLRSLGMIKKHTEKIKSVPFKTNYSGWVRSSESGFVQTKKNLGDYVYKDDVLAEIHNPFGDVIDQIFAHNEGVVIGMQTIPMVQEGDALFHIAFSKQEEEDVSEAYVEKPEENVLMELVNDPDNMSVD